MINEDSGQRMDHSATFRQRMVLASNNAGKLREFADLFAGLRIELLPQSAFAVAEVEESGLTFVENALLKARAASVASGLPAVADDSGLAVDALGGAPGLYSARYAGAGAGDAANNARLLAALAGVPEAQRTARYHCLLVLLRLAEDPAPLISHGIWEGRILTAARGAGGFGYDPLFWVESEQASAAELAPARKNQLSHRGQALRHLLRQLQP